MDFIIGIFIFLLGLCIGSFLNCAIWRMQKNESFVSGRSYCSNCKHSLGWLDLFPVASFLFLGGKCRYCHQKISIQYPLVEIITALVFLFVFSQSGTMHPANLVFLLFISAALIAIFIYDLKYYLIPDKILIPAILVTAAYRLFFIGSLGNYLLAAAVAAGFFLAIFLVSKGQWMGFGDVKLTILLGLVLGFPNILVGLFLSFFFGAIIGVILLFFKKKGLKSEVPFAPFLITGTFFALFWGPQIINWYSHFLLF